MPHETTSRIEAAPRPSQKRVVCRQIHVSDLEHVVDLLTVGFPRRTRKYWSYAVARMAARNVPTPLPRFGYVLEADGALVGVQLLIFTEWGGGIRCNASSWYVDPAHRGHATLLAVAATKLKHVTYINVSPSVRTWPILEALGYERYNLGQFASLPSLTPGSPGRARRLTSADADLPEYDLLVEHSAGGCDAVVCETPIGPEPFVFVRRRVRGLPFDAMQLVYTRETARFIACAGPLGRFLIRRGAPLVICDANEPIPELVGLWFGDRGARYYKGPQRPQLNDLAFTELVVFAP
jgi:hypothetical protein